MKTIMTLSNAIALSLTMGTAIAATESTVESDVTSTTTNKANRLLEKFDVNQDGSISGDEVQFVLAKKFTTADANADGLLTQDEMLAAREQLHQERAAKRFAKLDTDENGSLSVEEFQAGKPPAGKHCGGSKRKFSRHETSATREQHHQERAAKRFAKLDTDENGSLSVEEFQAGKPPAGKHGSRSERKFSRLDMDGDGMLSSIEINAPLVKKFERLDTDQDGVISAEELSQIPFGHRGGKHHRR